MTTGRFHHEYHLPRLDATEYATLCWLADRGYDGNLLRLAGVEEEHDDGGATLGGLPEHGERVLFEREAWEFAEAADEEGFLACNGSRSLGDKMLKLREEIV